MVRSVLGFVVVTLCLGSEAFASAPANGTLPPHIRRQIRRVVSANDALAVVTVQERLDQETLSIRVDRSVVGKGLPKSLEIASEGLAAEDLQPGATLLLPFRHSEDGWEVAPRWYELIEDGKIREYPAKRFLRAMKKEAVKAKAKKAAPVAARRAPPAAPRVASR